MATSPYLLGVVCLILVLAHYLFLGFATWDGLSYRVSPIVELLQHGSLGGWKFNYPPAREFYPFLELLHLPFFKALGLRGLYFDFSLILLPASVISVYGFVKALTDRANWATYSAIAFLAVPFVNTQPFSAYIDFAVIGAFAFFLYALLVVLKAAQPSFWQLVVLSIATCVFTMSRQQAPYIAVLTVVMFSFWFKPTGSMPRSFEEAESYPRRSLGPIIAAFVIGLLPAGSLHISRYLLYGSPIHPYQFKVLMFSTDVGLTPQYTAAGAGLVENSPRGLLSAFARGWLWPGELPGNFYDSRALGVGLLFWLMWLALPLSERLIESEHTKVIVLFVGISLVGKDFWLPRWSMTLVLGMVLLLGAAIAAAADRRSFVSFAMLLSVLGLHLARPLYDVYTLTQMNMIYHRVNIADSKLFVEGPGEHRLYPDLNADLHVVHPVENEWTLLLYGAQLSNRIVGVVDPASVGAKCQIPLNTSSDRPQLIVDQTGQLLSENSSCRWQCAAERDGYCLAGLLGESD